jgi:hypothetical protein
MLELRVVAVDGLVGIVLVELFGVGLLAHVSVESRKSLRAAPLYVSAPGVARGPAMNFA